MNKNNFESFKQILDAAQKISEDEDNKTSSTSELIVPSVNVNETKVERNTFVFSQTHNFSTPKYRK